MKIPLNKSTSWIGYLVGDQISKEQLRGYNTITMHVNVSQNFRVIIYNTLSSFHEKISKEDFFFLRKNFDNKLFQKSHEIKWFCENDSLELISRNILFICFKSPQSKRNILKISKYKNFPLSFALHFALGARNLLNIRTLGRIYIFNLS